MEKRLKKEQKKERQERMGYLKENASTAAKNLGLKHKLWTAPNQAVLRQMTRYKDYALDHPIAATGLGLATSAAVQGVVGAGAQYLNHKIAMKTNPNYEAETLRNIKDKKLKQGAYAPINPQALGRERIAPQKPELEQFQKPIYPSHAKPNTDVDKPNQPDEARPNGKFNQQAIKKGHQPQNAHIAVMRGMDMNTVNSAGLADSSKFKLNTETKTGTTKEDCGAVDAVFEMVDRLDEVAPIVSAGVRALGAVAKKGLSAAARGASSAAKTAGTHAVAGAAQTYGANKTQQHMDKKAAKTESFVASRLLQQIDEVYPIIAAAAPHALNLGLTIAGAAGSTYAANKVQQHLDKKEMAKAQKQSNSTPEQKQQTEETLNRVARLYEIVNTVKRASAKATLGMTKAASAVSGGLSNFNPAMSMAKKHAQKTLAKTESIFGESVVGAGALSPYEYNRYRSKSLRDAMHSDRSQFVNSGPARVKRTPKNFNAPKKRATDDPKFRVN
jgi:hypothetical protein